MKKKLILSCILMLVFAVCLKIIPLYAFDLPIYEETFEGSSNWSADNGVWEIGIPTSGPGECHEGEQCAGTVLDGNYPAYTDSRLIGPYVSPWEQGIELPEVIANEELHLRFWNWFNYSSYDSGRVQISVQDDATGEWGTWVNVGGAVSSYCGGWSLKDVDLSDYAGQTLRIGFLHVADRKYGNASEGPGWFIDDIQIIKKIPEFTVDFEMGWVDWSASTGVWQIGEPTSGPGECHEGEQCAGTVLDGNYPAYTDSRLVSATVVLDELTENEELHLRFWNWFNYSSYDSGRVQISVQDDATGEWGTWVNVGGAVSSYCGGWSLKDVDLSDYAGQTLRIGFLHVADRKYGNASEGPGWFIDDIQIIKKIPEFTVDFEMGWVDWSASTGVWQIGEPTSGPGECHEGEQCAGTVLDGNYPAYTDSRLVSATVVLDELTENEELHLRFWNWFNYSSYDSGRVQISVQDDATGEWGTWVNVGGAVSSYCGGWSLKDVDLSDYAGQTLRIGFLHVADRKYGNASEGPGWFIDDIQIIKKIPEFTVDFEMGWVDWSASTGVWQIGEPTSGPGECHEGEQCAGTVLDGNYPAYTDSRLVSATIDLSGCSASVVYLSFWEWFSYSSYDYGTVQISDWDSETEQWSGWVSLIQSTGTSTVWTHKYVDLTNYAEKVFRIGFLHVADRKYGNASEGPGWFVDNIELVGPTKIMPTINTISFASYIPDPCTSLIDVFASDPCDGELTYTWQLPDGGTLVGTGANMEFIPPEIREEPYRVRVAASSNATRISSFTKTLKIFTEVLYDLDGDGDIDGADLAEFLVNVEVNSITISRFAEEFGMIACQ